MTATPPFRSLPRALVALLRVKQWIKNVIVLAPLFFARRATDPASIKAALIACVAFCLLSSCVYVFNDLKDRDHDRLHPRKRLRPLASGEVGAAPAVAMGLGLGTVALALFAWIGRGPLLVALSYLALQAAYTLFLKRVALLDVLVISLGFVQRIGVGALAVGVPISQWLYLCTFLLALFLGLGKRRSELVALEDGAAAHRANLGELSVGLLDQLLSIAACASIVCYALYTLSPETIAKFGTDGLKFTMPCVVYGVFRYLYLLHRGTEGESPERLLVADAPTLVNLALFGLIAGAVLYL